MTAEKEFRTTVRYSVAYEYVLGLGLTKAEARLFATIHARATFVPTASGYGETPDVHFARYAEVNGIVLAS